MIQETKADEATLLYEFLQPWTVVLCAECLKLLWFSYISVDASVSMSESVVFCLRKISVQARLRLIRV